MGGLIRGFLGGVGQAAADFGKMQLAATLQNERDEANFLRDKELQGTEFEFRTGEREASQKFTASESKADRTSREREGEADRKAALERTKITAAAKSPPKPQLIKYTDSKGFEQEGVLQENSDGTYRIIKPENDEVVVESVTIDELKNMAAKINTEEGGGFFGASRATDLVPFNELSYKDERVRAAAAEEREKKGSTGLVGGAMDKKKTRADTGEEIKDIGGGVEMTKSEFIKAMTARYGKDKIQEIEETWDLIK